MKKNFKFVALAMLAMTTAFTSCDDPNNGGDPETGDKELKGDLTTDLTLEANTTYELTGEFYVKDGVTLTIEEGVKIIAQDVEDCPFILIEQGGKIEAVGTASNPIVMTSEIDKAGAWGGLHICGYAPVNTSDSKSEVGSKPYGGTIVGDNSGTIKYVRLENTGFSYSADQECNGISFYGVGNGTTVSYVQAYHGTDDGLEFFGGTVNIDHIVVTSVSDDSYDWTDGWVGCGQFLVAYQDAKVTGSKVDYDCDCLMECDNQGDNPIASPMSHPTLANVTLIGNNSSSKKNGVNLKAGTEISLYNAIITGKDAAISFKKDDNAVTNYSSGNSIISGVNINNSDLYLTWSETVDGTKTTVWGADNSLTNKFVAEANNMISQAFTPENKYAGIVDGGVSLPAVADSNFSFEATSYKGAVDPSNDWTAGWTRQ
ncbi:MAG: hypothetical protein R3Y22_03485 [Bacteroidales bacterium]